MEIQSIRHLCTSWISALVEWRSWCLTLVAKKLAQSTQLLSDAIISIQSSDWLSSKTAQPMNYPGNLLLMRSISTPWYRPKRASTSIIGRQSQDVQWIADTCRTALMRSSVTCKISQAQKSNSQSWEQLQASVSSTIPSYAEVNKTWRKSQTISLSAKKQSW